MYDFICASPPTLMAGFVLHYVHSSLIETMLCVMAGKVGFVGPGTDFGFGLHPMLHGPPPHVPRPGAVR